MTRITVTSDDRRELDRVRAILSRSYTIQQEKAPETKENRRHRLYLFVTPKRDPYSPGKPQKPVKNGDVKSRESLAP